MRGPVGRGRAGSQHKARRGMFGLPDQALGVILNQENEGQAAARGG
jgi:hypothetical protein